MGSSFSSDTTVSQGTPDDNSHNYLIWFVIAVIILIVIIIIIIGIGYALHSKKKTQVAPSTSPPQPTSPPPVVVKPPPTPVATVPVSTAVPKA